MSRPTYFFSLPRGGGIDALEGKFASSEPLGRQAAADEATPLREFAGKFWFAELQGEHKALSTEEIAAASKTAAGRGP